MRARERCRCGAARLPADLITERLALANPYVTVANVTICVLCSAIPETIEGHRATCPYRMAVEVTQP